VVGAALAVVVMVAVVYALRFTLPGSWVRALAIAVLLMLVLGTWRTWWLSRRVSRIASRHRRGAEFG
jgi:hypothetical protein